MAFRKENKIKSNFSKISIGLASPGKKSLRIRVVKVFKALKPSNYRTYKPERDGFVLRAYLRPDQRLRMPLR